MNFLPVYSCLPIKNGYSLLYNNIQQRDNLVHAPQSTSQLLLMSITYFNLSISINLVWLTSSFFRFTISQS